MSEQGADTASVDLSIAFFCSILVVFVFVAFSVVRDPPKPVPQSIAQRVETREVGVPGWNAINTRGNVAIFRDGILTTLSLARITAGLRDPSLAYTGDLASTSFLTVPDAAPNTYLLEVYLESGGPPEAWVQSQVDLASPDFTCPEAGQGRTMVFVMDTEAEIARLETFGQTCDVWLRYQFIEAPKDDTAIKLRFVQTSKSFKAENMFR